MKALIPFAMALIFLVPLIGFFVRDSQYRKLRSLTSGAGNILIGIRAGEDITVGTLQFRFTIPDYNDGVVGQRLCEYSTHISSEEFQILAPVVRRAAKNTKYIPVEKLK